MRESRWVHYPRSGEDNIERDSFKDAEVALYKLERERRLARRKRETEEPITLDLDKEEVYEQPVDAPLGVRHEQPLGHLIASGGLGGLGNPHFLTVDNRSPKFATKGQEGERVTLSLELKILADIGLVGMPNAGKSTLLRALTGGRAKSEVAGYAFTTLNPIVGVVRVAEDGAFEGGLTEGLVYEETLIEEERERQKLIRGEYADTLTRNQNQRRHEESSRGGQGQNMNEDADLETLSYKAGHQFDLVESFRFTIADNPGLISRASENVGLGHSFLRSMERSLALAYVVDLSGPAPWDELVILRDELEKYQPGMSAKARMVVANKADLLGGDGADPAAVEAAKAKLRRLEEFVRSELPPHRRSGLEGEWPLDVVPISAKYSQNLRRVVGLMRRYVEDAREDLAHRSEVEARSTFYQLGDD
ncbi:hypothetical protein AX16_006795 [Volvariella volvacea WC 439]|nr:hypothetical protein AX16_006795 [Volvariella volvacea WC 439]